MDQPGLDEREHREALAALRRINVLSRSVPAFWPPIRDFCRERRRENGERPVRLLDLATGGGDLPVLLWKRARREGFHLEVAGCDRSPSAVSWAIAGAARAGAAATFFEHDAIAGGIPPGYDILMSSLFLHHLGEEDALAFLRALGLAGRLVVLDDLTRGASGWALAYLGVRLLSRSRLAHVDGPISVEGAFTADEVSALACRAGWRDFRVRTRWPCRMLLTGRFG
jgi:2-polyprenyl-3-methyl-5-hydroxy-6-metoxy-1,4-benzoquinol methylase